MHGSGKSAYNVISDKETMKGSFAPRTPGEAPVASRGMLGLFTKSQSNHGPEPWHASMGPSSDSDDDGDPNHFRYPGMPREPRPIKLSDPYPGGRLAGSQAEQELQPLVHDGSTTVLFIKAGSEHRALLYLMQKVNRLFALDDMLPEVAPEIAAYHYLLLAPPKDGPMDGDASTSFRNSTLFMLSGMVLRRIKVLARDPYSFGLLDSTVLQRRMPLRKLAVRLAANAHDGPLTPGPGGAAGSPHGSSGGGANPLLRRKSSFAARLGPEGSGQLVDLEPAGRHAKRASGRRVRRTGPPELVPVAIYSHPTYLDTAASIIRNFNRTGLLVTPYLYSTVVAAAAVATIQGWWRSHKIRGLSNFGALLRMGRAARVIQRAWRAFLLRTRLAMLGCIRRLAATVGSLLLGANLALTAGHCAALRERGGRPRPGALFPEQRLRFGFNRAGGLLLVEPERMMPRSVKDGNWSPGLPPPPVPRSLPEWCGVPLPLVGERGAVSVHGCREVLGLGSVLQLLTRDTVWRDNSGNEIPRTTLPDTTPPDPGALAATLAGGGSPADVVLAIITFPSVHEAAVRAALLSAYTWDPLRRTGVNLVPLHQTAAARGVQTQAAVAQAINTIATSAGRLVTTPPEAVPEAAPTAVETSPSPSMYTSTSALVWRHAPPGSRERQLLYRGGGGGGGGGGGTPTRSPIRGSTGGGGSSALPSGIPSPKNSSSLCLSRSHSHSHSHGHHGTAGPGSPGRGGGSGSPSRAVSPMRQRGGGGGGGASLGSPSTSPRRVPRSPQHPHAQHGVHGGRSTSPMASPRRAAAAVAATSPMGSPQRGATPPLPPLHARPGTVTAISPSKFQDLEVAAAAVVGTGGGGEGLVRPRAPASSPAFPLPHLQIRPQPSTGVGSSGGTPRPHATPPQAEFGATAVAAPAEGSTAAIAAVAAAVAAGLSSSALTFSTEASTLGSAPHGQTSRSSGGLYGTLPGAPTPLDNVPLSALARALSPPTTHRLSGTQLTAAGGGGGAPVSGALSSLSLPPSISLSQSQLSIGAAGAGSAGEQVGTGYGGGGSPSKAPYRGYDMPVAGGGGGGGGLEPPPGGGGAAAVAASAGAPVGGGGDVEEEAWSGAPGGEAGGQEERQAGAQALQDGPAADGTEAAAALPGERNDTGAPHPGEEPGPAALAEREEEEEEVEEVQAGEGGDGGGDGGGEWFEGGEAVTVLQRHQAMGLYHDMLLLPVPRNRGRGPEWGPERPPPPPEWAEQGGGSGGEGGEVEAGTYEVLGRERQPSAVSLAYSDTGDVGTDPRDAVAAAATTDGGGAVFDPAADTAADDDENPELVVAPLAVQYVRPAALLAELAESLGEQGRIDRNFADNTARIGKLITAEERFARHRQLMSTLMLTQVIGRQTAVGHLHAPNYVPLSSGAMNAIVGEMRRVYRGEAAELVANMRVQHREAIAAVRQELEAAVRAVAATSCMQAAVVDSEIARVEEERTRIARSRATRAHLRALRRERAAQDRAFAAAFGRQVAGASKHIVRSEIRARDAVLAESTAATTALRRELDKVMQEHISQAASEAAAANRLRASLVRSEGWTSQVASHYHTLDQWQADQVALRRDENYARMRRVGPAGGVWGNARPRELLRAPLPVTNVVSAAAAAAAAAAAGPWRSLSAGDARPPPPPHTHTTLSLYTPPDSAGGGGYGGDGGGNGLFDRMPPGGGGGGEVTRVSFGSAWPLFEGDNGSLAASSPPMSALPAPRRPLPQPLPEGYVPGGAAAAAAEATPPPPLLEDSSEAATTMTSVSQADYEASEGGGGAAAAAAKAVSLRPGAKASALAALAAASGLRQRGSPPRNLVEGADGRLVDFLPEAYSVQPFGSRQGGSAPRPVGMVVSRY